MNQMSLVLGLSNGVFSYGFKLLVFQISSWSIYLLSGIMGFIESGCWCCLWLSVVFSRLFDHWNNTEVYSYWYSGLLEIIITVESYVWFAFVLVYGLPRSRTRILCKVGLENDREQWIWWRARTFLQCYPTCIYFCFRSQSLPKEEWDRVAIIMVRRLRLQWKFMVIHRDKGLLAFALHGLSLRGEATWSRYKLRPQGLVFQQVWWWEIWWAIRIEYLVVIMKVWSYLCHYGLYSYNFIWWKDGMEGLILAWRKLISIEFFRWQTLAQIKLRGLWICGYLQSKAMNINGSRRGKVWKPLVISIRRWLVFLYCQPRVWFEWNVYAIRNMYRRFFFGPSELYRFVNASRPLISSKRIGISSVKNWYFGAINCFAVDINCDDEIDFHGYIIVGSCGSRDCRSPFAYETGFTFLWRISDNNWTILVVSLWIVMEWFGSQIKENIWNVDIGYHYTHKLGSPEHKKNNFLNAGIELELSRNGK